MGDYSDSSNNLQFLFKKSLGIVSTFKDTAFYNEIARRFRTPVQVEDVNIETAPTLPEWNDYSDNSLFNLGSDDFASVDFTELHTFDTTYTKNGTKSPGVWLDASGTVALFVRLKLDKMEGDASSNLDASAIVYMKRDYTKNESPSVHWTESNNYSEMNGYLSLIDTTRPLTINRGATWKSGGFYIYYSESLSTFVDLSTAVATVDLQTNTSNTVILDQMTEVFMLVRNTWSNTPSTDGWTRVDDGTIDYLTTQTYTYIYRRIYKPGTYDFNNTTAAYIFQTLPESSLMDSAYQFNYNSQINVNSSIPVFKPYNYTLEYSSDDSTFYQVTNDTGNWSFDTNSGTIIFENDPSLNNNIIDLSNGDLYFTFVKYVGLQGIQNLIYHDASGHSGIGTKDPQSELDISGSMRITKDLTLTEDLYVSLTDVLHVDSTNKTVSIGLDTANYSASGDLHVVGDTEITGTLNIGSGIGPGMCPIGTIIIWVKNTPPSGYGTWLLCDGQNCSTYTSLQAIVGDTVPDLRGSYSRGGPIGSENEISYGGSNSTSSISLAAANLPTHGHDCSGHGHTVTSVQHTHATNVKHAHSVSGVNSHTHGISAHSHKIDDSNTNHNHKANAQHAHNVTTTGHQHATNHSHSDVNVSHLHEYDYFNDFKINDAKRGNEASNLIDSIEKRISGVSTNTSVAVGTNSSNGEANCNASNFQTGQATCNIKTANLNSTTVDLDSGQVYSSNITSNSVGAESNDSTWNTDPSVQDSAVKCVDASFNVTLGQVDQSSHNVSGTSGTNYGVSFNFDSVNLSCVEIFYYIRAE